MTINIFEAEVSRGLESIVAKEISNQNTFTDVQISDSNVQFVGPLTDSLKNLLTMNSIYLLLRYKIPRPKALLGHEHFKRFLDAVQRVMSFSNTEAFETFYISAAGSDSSVMQRIKTDISKHINLPEGNDNGDLLIRIRRNRQYGWDVLIRITPRPHATRAWRMCNYEGALNGPTAHAMIALSKPASSDTVVNLTCGSGTLMIERLTHSSAGLVLGFDNNETALTCAHENINNSKLNSAIKLFKADARQLPLPRNFATHIYADLPFGQRIGTHDKNVSQYPDILNEAGRICQAKGIFTLITHEIRLIEQIIQNSTYWTLQNMVKITQRGYHPRIYVLQRK